MLFHVVIHFHTLRYDIYIFILLHLKYFQFLDVYTKNTNIFTNAIKECEPAYKFAF